MKKITVALSVLFLAAASAQAGDSPADIKQRLGSGDPVAGKAKAAMCQGCHGEDGNSPAPNFPKLAGQYADYLSKQVLDFQAGTRADPMMTGMAAAVTDKKDMADISAYFASQKQMSGAGAKNDAGRKLYMEGDPSRGIYGCVNCHGANGKGMSPENAFFPVVGGQHKDYLAKQLTDMQSGARKNDPGSMMSVIAKRLSAADITAVAEYLSGL